MTVLRGKTRKTETLYASLLLTSGRVENCHLSWHSAVREYSHANLDCAFFLKGVKNR